MSTGTRAVEVAHLATLSALTVVTVVDPTARLRSDPDWSGWLRGQQSVDRVMSRVGPPSYLSSPAAAGAAAAVAAARRRPGLAVARALAAGCVAAAVRVTLTVNAPENARLRTWRPDDVPPDDWRAVRARWDEGHRQRQLLVAAAAGVAVLGEVAALTSRGRPG